MELVIFDSKRETEREMQTAFQLHRGISQNSVHLLFPLSFVSFFHSKQSLISILLQEMDDPLFDNRQTNDKPNGIVPEHVELHRR